MRPVERSAFDWGSARAAASALARWNAPAKSALVLSTVPVTFVGSGFVTKTGLTRNLVRRASFKAMAAPTARKLMEYDTISRLLASMAV